MSELSKSLRGLADFFEANPSLEEYMPHFTPLPEFSLYPHDRAEVIASVTRAFGTCQKEWADTLLYLRKDFGAGITLRAVFSRDAICVKKVVGQKVIPAQPERVIPAEPERTEDIVEWECSESSLLAAGQ